MEKNKRNVKLECVSLGELRHLVKTIKDEKRTEIIAGCLKMYDKYNMSDNTVIHIDKNVLDAVRNDKKVLKMVSKKNGDTVNTIETVVVDK